jgi:hypothetical protein
MKRPVMSDRNGMTQPPGVTMTNRHHRSGSEPRPQTKRATRTLVAASLLALLAACGGGDDVATERAMNAVGGSPGLIPSEPVTVAGVVPETREGNNQGDPPTTCQALFPGVESLSELKLNTGEDPLVYDPLRGNAYPTGISLETYGADGDEKGLYLKWSTPGDPDYDYHVYGIVVKGGNAHNVYDYLAAAGSDPFPKVTKDEGLGAPAFVNNAGKTIQPAISHYNVCYVPVPKMKSQWCSPGYWRQPQHLGSWAATGIAPTELYSSYFGTPPVKSTAKPCRSASANPTLLQVLELPQCYGGAAFNAVGDLLSEAHPDVNFTGERVPDSCPLN